MCANSARQNNANIAKVMFVFVLPALFGRINSDSEY